MWLFLTANQAGHEACNQGAKVLGIGQTVRDRRGIVDLSIRGKNVEVRLSSNKEAESVQCGAVLVLQSRDAQARMPHDTETSWVGFVTVLEGESRRRLLFSRDQMSLGMFLLKPSRPSVRVTSIK